MQVVLVILCISAAALYLGLQVYQRIFKKDANCDACAMGKIKEK